MMDGAEEEAGSPADRRVLQPGEELLYTGHARDRMAEFGIGEEDVRATLEAPDRTYPALPRPSAPPTIVYRRHIGPRECKVYVDTSSLAMRVKTVAWHGEGPQGRGSGP